MTTPSPSTIAALGAQLNRDLLALTSAAPQHDPEAHRMAEADWDQVGLSVALVMRTCAEYLEEAGFDADAALAIADEAEAEFARLAATRPATA